MNTPSSAKKQHVIVGLSGGVDSSVAAILLQQQGYAVEGMFMKNWEEDDTEEYCSATVDLADARSVSESLGLNLHTVNFSAEYWDRVFSHFLQEYEAGRTPNPDILCNREIKFRAFLDHAIELGADYIATGHYARVRRENGRYQLLKGKDNAKDQSYFLYTLGQRQLAHSLFPVGELEKSEVRRTALEHQLVTHDKKDSTGICFIGERNFREFLSRYLPAKPGEIQTPEGEVIGRHSGLMYYTLGQRQGLGIGGVPGAPDEPWYVVGKDLEHNVLLAAQGHDHPLLFSRRLRASQLSWVDGQGPSAPLHCRAKTRYRQADQECTLTRLDEQGCEVEFAQPQRAITPGQSVVFYDGDVCLGGGIIESTD
ncbi:MAG: tRNA 2-thiouridine(34) synthase MnmA [Gammaproteobacteria bacterium]|nr:tRNA 2-thiouridine(34) synthase MnmA [Gammaproteobacteria bacterium]MCW8993269.1 tRNA 2-thiouridine(34) synthase MnmA [Gammaproteobacteria bacterium]